MSSLTDPPELLFEGPAPKAPAKRVGPMADPAMREKSAVTRAGNRAALKKTQLQLQTEFTKNVLEIWEDQGESILRRSAFADPMGFAKLVASMAPKQLDVNVNAVQEIDDDKLEDLIGAIDGLLAGRLGGAQGKARAGEVIEGFAEEAVVLPAIREAEGVPRSGDDP